MDIRITLLKGDGIGPEIVDEAVKVMEKIGSKYKYKFDFKRGYLGGESIDKYGVPLSQETIDMCKESHSILLGAVGGPKWDNIEPHLRPEMGLLEIRKALDLYCNLRPATVFSSLKDASPLKESIIGDGLDLMVVRELTGGIYFGPRERLEDKAYDTLLYTKPEIERIAKKAFEIARIRGGKLTSIDKRNVLDSSKLWRDTVVEISENYKDVELNHMYVDNAAMQLISNPRQFNVILTGNMFGDILSDEASQITGSIGMLPSASLNESSLGIYEPIHGSAPDIADQNIANPIATILSAAMMMKYSLNMKSEGEIIEKAVEEVLNRGYRTRDIYTEGTKLLSTTEMGDMICQFI